MVGAAPIGDAPTISEWSTILLPTKVRLILEVLRDIFLQDCLTGAVLKDVYMIHRVSPFGILTTTNSGTLQWSHNGRDGVQNHQPHDCLLNRSFRRRSNKTLKLRVTGLCVGNSPVRWKMVPFDGVIMRNVHVIGQPSVWVNHYWTIIVLLG